MAALKYEKNKERILTASKKYYEENHAQARATRKAYFYTWSRENSDQMRAHTARRRAARLQRTPSWADLELIDLIYKMKPKGYAVDHIVPLQGELVSGLHVHENLQYLTISDNCSKGNRYA